MMISTVSATSEGFVEELQALSRSSKELADRQLRSTIALKDVQASAVDELSMTVTELVQSAREATVLLNASNQAARQAMGGSTPFLFQLIRFASGRASNGLAASNEASQSSSDVYRSLTSLLVPAFSQRELDRYGYNISADTRLPRCS